MDFTVPIISLSLILFWIYQRKTIFKRRNIPHLSFSWSRFREFQTEHVYKLYQIAYDHLKGKGPIGGFFINFTPFFMITDVNLIKRICIQDFSYFTSRGVYNNVKYDPMTATLDSLEGDQWKRMRTKLSPTLSIGKLKSMFPAIQEKCEKLCEAIKNNHHNPDFDVKQLICGFAAEAIGSCAFSLNLKTMENPNDLFFKMAIMAFSKVRIFTFLGTLAIEYKKIIRSLRIRRIPFHITQYFNTMISKSIERRKAKNVEINDFLGYLIKMHVNKSLTYDEIMASSFVVLAAGMEPIASTLGNLIYHLALDQQIQDRARLEISKLLHKYGEEITYEHIKEAVYLQQIAYETLRYHPTTAQLLREAVKDYHVPDTNIVIKKGERLLASFKSINMDKDLFPEPHTFNPDRFGTNFIQTNSNFLSFGIGPRACLGEKLAYVEIKTAVMMILKNFKIFPTEKTPKEIIYDKNYHFLTSTQNLHLFLEPI